MALSTFWQHRETHFSMSAVTDTLVTHRSAHLFLRSLKQFLFLTSQAAHAVLLKWHQLKCLPFKITLHYNEY